MKPEQLLTYSFIESRLDKKIPRSGNELIDYLKSNYSDMIL